MFIQNINELNEIVQEINNLSVQLDLAFKKLDAFDIKINPEYLQKIESVQEQA